VTSHLLWRNAVLRGLPVWVVMLFVNAVLMLGLLRTAAAARGAALSDGWVLLVGCLTLALYFVLVAGRPRCGALDVALPIPGRTLWLTHLVGLAAVGTLVVAGFTAIARTVAFPLRGAVPYHVDWLRLALTLESGLLLAIALLQAPQPALVRITWSRRYLGWILFVLLAVPALVLRAAASGSTASLVLLGIAALVAGWTYRSVPPALALVPREPGEGRARRSRAAAAEESAAGAAAASGWRASLSVLRCLTAGGKELALLPIVVLFGLLTGGAFEASAIGAEARDLRFYYIPMATYMLFTLVGPRLSWLHALDPLPIGRRWLVAGMLLPTAAVFVASYGVGVLARHFGRPVEYVDFVEEREGHTWSVSAPLRAFDVSWDGRVDAVTSPWGETHRPQSFVLSRAARAEVVNPFSAPPGSSSRFVALQISRAVEAVYGLSIPPELVERRWLETRPDGTVTARGGDLRIGAEHPGLTPRAGPMFPVLMVLVGVPWLLLVAAVYRSYRAAIPDWGRQAVFWGAAALFVLLMMVQAATLVTGVVRPWAVRAVIEIAVWELGRTTTGIVFTWVVSALLLYGAYRIAEAQFLRSEIPARPTMYSLLDRMRETDRG